MENENKQELRSSPTQAHRALPASQGTASGGNESSRDGSEVTRHASPVSSAEKTSVATLDKESREEEPEPVEYLGEIRMSRDFNTAFTAFDPRERSPQPCEEYTFADGTFSEYGRL